MPEKLAKKFPRLKPRLKWIISLGGVAKSLKIWSGREDLNLRASHPRRRTETAYAKCKRRYLPRK